MSVCPNTSRLLRVLAALVLSASSAFAQASGEDLAKKLSNPVASLISLPFQSNWDRGIGLLDRGTRYTLNVQPVIPFEITPHWNMISRTITPIIRQNEIGRGTGVQLGIGDIVQSLFFSPVEPGPGGIIWGAGPVFLVPTGSDPLLSASQWGAGPTAVVLKQSGPWTIGVLGNHIWSFAETRTNAPAVNVSYVNPFINYTTSDQWTFGLAAEATYDWQRDKLTMPVVTTVSKLVMFGKQPVSFTLGGKYYAITPENGPKGFGARASVVFLFPT
jgi:hypothetical protein